MKRIHLLILFTAIVASIFQSCNNQGNSSREGSDNSRIITRHAKLLTLVEHDGYTVARIKNPWDTTSILANYILLTDSSAAIDRDPNAVTISVPLKSSLVYSGVHGGAICELGALTAITSVADGGYFTHKDISQRIQSGLIADVGSSMSPSIEKIVEQSPAAILLSPYQNSGHGAIATLGIPIIEMADYMEPTPIGRAEWIKLLGLLYGKEREADSIFNSVRERYDSLCAITASVKNSPSVVTEIPVNGVWSLPAGKSYMSQMIRDAGASYPWADTKGSGSIEMQPAAVLDKAENASFWLIRSYGDLDKRKLKSDVPLSPNFEAFKNGNIFVCNTALSPLFDEFPFHPEKLLRDYIIIFHPELTPNEEPHYFNRIN